MKITGLLGLDYTCQYVLWSIPSWFFFLCEKKHQKYLSPVQMVHIGAKQLLTLDSSYHSMVSKSQGKTYQDWVISTWSHKFDHRWEITGGIPHLIFLTPFMYLFRNIPPHYWNELTQLNSKISRHIQNFSAVHVHSTWIFLYSMMCCTFVPHVHASWRYNRETEKGWFCKYTKDMNFHIFWNNGMPCFPIFFELSPSILYKPQSLFSK